MTEQETRYISWVRDLGKGFMIELEFNIVSYVLQKLQIHTTERTFDA